MSYEDDDCMSRSEIGRWKRDREIAMDDQVYGVPAEERPTVEPCRPNPPLTTPAKLGNHFAQAAWKAGCEDEYQNAIDAKYGPGY
jgi:hypothetical protein